MGVMILTVRIHLNLSISLLLSKVISHVQSTLIHLVLWIMHISHVTNMSKVFITRYQITSKCDKK